MFGSRIVLKYRAILHLIFCLDNCSELLLGSQPQLPFILEGGHGALQLLLHH